MDDTQPDQSVVANGEIYENGDIKGKFEEQRSALSDSGSYDSHAAVYREHEHISTGPDKAKPAALTTEADNDGVNNYPGDMVDIHKNAGNIDEHENVNDGCGCRNIEYAGGSGTIYLDEDNRSACDHGNCSVSKSNNGEEKDHTCEGDNVEEINEIEAEKDHFTDWRSPSTSENSCLDKSHVTSHVGTPEVRFNGDILTFHRTPNKKSDAEALVLPQSAFSPTKDRVSGGLRDSSYESSAELRRSFMNLKGASWPLAEGQCASYSSSSASVSFKNKADENESLINRSPEADARNVNSPNDDENDENGGKKEEEEDTSFSIRKLTKQQLIILGATSFTNLLSFLSLSILAPFFPAEVSALTFSFVVLK